MERIETWRAINGFPGYEVSDLGRVRSFRRQGRRGPGATEVVDKCKVLSPRKQQQPGCKTIYVSACMRRDGKSIGRLIHLLVLDAFVGLCPPGMEARHRDGDGQNNRAENLLWDTHENNIEDRRTHGTNCEGEKHGRAILTEEKALEALELSRQGWMQKDIAAKLGVGRTTITLLVTGKTWKHLRRDARPETTTG